MLRREIPWSVGVERPPRRDAAGEDGARFAFDVVALETDGADVADGAERAQKGADRNPVPVLRAALPRLMFVTISGADTGDTKAMGWDRLIQPLDAGTYDLGAFVRTLRTVGYTGPVGFQGYNIKGEPRAILTRSIAAWRTFDSAAR